MTAAEAYLRAFHALDPGCTRRALDRAGTYELVAAQVPAGARVLDLGAGSGALGERLPGRLVLALDLSLDELRAGRGPRLQARATELPLRDACVDAVCAHLVLALVGELDPVLDEIARVLVPGGRLVALLGGGPRAGADDAYTRALADATPVPWRTDPRLRSTRGIAAALERHFDAIEQRDHDVDLSGTPDEVAAFLAAQYELSRSPARAVAALCARGDRVPCAMHVRVVTAVRRGAAS